jgi:hypothetical protein
VKEREVQRRFHLVRRLWNRTLALPAKHSRQQHEGPRTSENAASWDLGGEKGGSQDPNLHLMLFDALFGFFCAWLCFFANPNM